MGSQQLIPRERHIISRSNIDAKALKVLYRLKDNGYAAYLVGGCVRDLLLGKIPKDFDVVTNALPEQIKKSFRNCRLIGKRFRLAHIYFGDEIIEVATFRAGRTEESADRSHNKSGMILRDNVYGTVEEDAWRRDFTINALYYNIEDFSVVDFVDGMKDLQHTQLKLIGDPEARYIEDPVRMLRAVRFAAKLQFTIHPDTEAPLTRLAPLLKEISPARLYEEVIKLFHCGYSKCAFTLLRRYKLFDYLFPLTAQVISRQGDEHLSFIMSGFDNTDQRLADNKSVTPAFLFAVLLWQPLQNAITYWTLQLKLTPVEVMDVAIDKTLREQTKSVTIPHRLSAIMREIWKLQTRLEKYRPRSIKSILQNRRFRAAYDFLLLRSQFTIELAPIVAMWTELQLLSPAELEQYIHQLKHSAKRTRR